MKTFEAQKSFHVVQTALQYKPLYNINRSENWGKKIQITGYNGARTVNIISHNRNTFVLYTTAL